MSGDGEHTDFEATRRDVLNVTSPAIADDQPAIRIVTGDRRRELIDLATATTEFEKLKAELFDDRDYDFERVETRALAVTTASGNTRYGVSFALSEGDTTVDIFVFVEPEGEDYAQNQEAESAKGAITTYGDDPDVEFFTVDDGSIEDHVVGLPDEIEATASDCEICKVVTKAACKVGCGAGAAAICMAATAIDPIVGAGCGIMAFYVCSVIDEFSCSDPDVEREVCKQIGYC